MQHAGRIVLMTMLMFWSLFPNDDRIRVIGIGGEGARFMLLDILVFVAVLLALGSSLKDFWRGIRSVSLIGVTVFLSLATLSLLRGFPEFAGFAIGEARWYYLFILLPTSFVLFRENFLTSLTQLFVLAAVVHTLRIPVLYLTGTYEESTLGVIRFVGGRDILVIAIAILLLLHQGIVRRRFSQGTIVLLAVFSLAIIVNQVRSFLFIFPLVLMFYLTMQRVVTFRRLLFGGGLALVSFVVMFELLRVVLPDALFESIANSIPVLTDLVNPATYAVLFDIGDVDYYLQNEFSQAGNTFFRLLAWSQTINEVLDTPGGWLWGLPMGSGFYFRDAMGGEYINLDPHNDYISIFSKIGLIGLIGYGIIIGSYARQFFKYRQTGATPNDVMVTASIVFFLIIFVTVNAEIRSYASHFLIWIFLGMSLRQLRSSRHPHVVAVHSLTIPDVKPST